MDALYYKGLWLGLGSGALSEGVLGDSPDGQAGLCSFVGIKVRKKLRDGELRFGLE